MWGWSGAGAHVLACAALLPDLVAAAASLAGVAPYGADGLDYFAGMSQGDVDYNRLVPTDPEAARAETDKEREGLLASSASDVAPRVRVHVGAGRCSRPAGRGRDG